MTQPIPSHAEPLMIVWCRERAGVSVQDVADRLALSDSDVLFWEYGERTPTLAQLKALAKFLRFPTAIFYLSKPPAWKPIKDFRRIPESEKGRLSRELAYWTRIAQGRKEWLAAYLKSHGQQRLPYVGATNISASASTVSGRLRRILNIDLNEQKAFRDKDEAFRRWRSACESAGVAVFLTRKVRTKEMRGFAISDQVAPVIAVNDQDSSASRIFTLMHEMTHILLGISGISECVSDNVAVTPDDTIEVFCNAVAGETLVPRSDFIATLAEIPDPETAVGTLSETYNVSEEVIARRLLDLQFTSQAQFLRIMGNLQRRREARTRKKKTVIKIKQARAVLGTVGRRFGNAVLSAYREDDITGSEASDWLDMKAQFLPDLENELRGHL